VGRFLGTRYLSESKQGARNSRTGLVQKKKNEANYLCAFFKYETSFELTVQCCRVLSAGQLEKDPQARQLHSEMNIDSKTVFEFPSFLVEEWRKCGKI
jgi:hypothetical protein